MTDSNAWGRKRALIAEVCARSNISISELRIAVALLNNFHNTNSGRCDPGVPAIMKATGLCRSVVFRAIEKLEGKAILRRSTTGGGATRNSYAFPALDPSTPVDGSMRVDGSIDVDPTRPHPGTPPVYDRGPAPSTPVDPNKEGNRKKNKEENETRVRAAFDRFWKVWPNKVGKPAAEKAFRKHEGSIETILEGVQRYIEAKPADRQWLNPATFLNQRRWEDEPACMNGSRLPVDPSDPMLDFPGGFSRRQSFVIKAIERWNENKHSWPVSELSAPPDSPSCCAPHELLIAHARVDFRNGCSAPCSSLRSLWSRGLWPPDWGPRPGEPGCLVPESFLAGINAEPVT